MTYEEIKKVSQDYCTYWFNRYKGDSIPSEMRLSFDKINMLLVDWLQNFGTFNKRTKQFVYKTKYKQQQLAKYGKLEYTGKTTYPFITSKKCKHLPIKEIVYDWFDDMIIFKFPSSKNEWNVSSIKHTPELYKDLLQIKSHGKYQEIVELLRDIVYQYPYRYKKLKKEEEVF